MTTTTETCGTCSYEVDECVCPVCTSCGRDLDDCDGLGRCDDSPENR